MTEDHIGRAVPCSTAIGRVLAVVPPPKVEFPPHFKWWLDAQWQTLRAFLASPYSLAELIERSGLSRRQVHRMLFGNIANITLGPLAMISYALGLRIKFDLMPIPDPPEVTG